MLLIMISQLAKNYNDDDDHGGVADDDNFITTLKTNPTLHFGKSDEAYQQEDIPHNVL